MPPPFFRPCFLAYNHVILCKHPLLVVQTKISCAGLHKAASAATFPHTPPANSSTINYFTSAGAARTDFFGSTNSKKWTDRQTHRLLLNHKHTKDVLIMH